MTEGTEGRHRHFILEGVTETEAYSSLRQRVKRPQVPEQDRAQHGGELQRQINELREEADSVREVQRRGDRGRSGSSGRIRELPRCRIGFREFGARAFRD